MEQRTKGQAMTTPAAPLAKYQAYELVNMENRSILHIPAPGAEVCLASDVEPMLEECEEVLDVLVNLIPDIGKLTKVQHLIHELKARHS